MMRSTRAAGKAAHWWLASVCVVAGCHAACPFSGQHAVTRVELFFGRDIPGGGQVGAKDWREFAAGVLTPALPDGFTVFEAAGQWRNPADFSITREPTLVVLIAGNISRARLDAVTSAYRLRFRQVSVGVLSSEACGAF